MRSAATVSSDATTTTAAGDPVNATDAIIEELKMLARSMLEATNAARRKLDTGERARGYDTLLRAVHGSEAGARGAATAAQAKPLPPAASSSTMTRTAASDKDNAGAAVAVVDGVVEHVQHGGSDRSRHVDPALPRTDDDDGGADDDGAAADVQHKPCHRRDDNVDVDRDEDDDANVYDGVHTQVLFRSTDTAAYDALLSSMWKPEALWRHTDGTTSPYNSDDIDNDDDADEKDGDGDDDEVMAHMMTRRQARRVAVYRVPLFPYGGGVTDAQARELLTHFAECIHKERKRDGAMGGRGSKHAAAASPHRPSLVRGDAFVQRRYDEVPSADALASRAPFHATSPYDFVVEVEQRVVFDAVRARAERRRAFERLVREERAPATMGTFNLRIIMDPLKTGFEEEKDFPIVRGSVVADRYEIIQLLGKATFSRAVRCYDLHQPIYNDDDDDNDDDDKNDGDDNDAKGDEDGASASCKPREPSGYAEVCLKIINNSKDFFDQSLDEIRLLTLINRYKDPDEAHVLRLIDAFYYKEHTMLVTELLSDNLYEYSKYNRKYEDEPYFTLPRLRRIAWQVLEALAYVHSLNLIHTDLKPENILFVSHRRCVVKVIDFGSSCFLSDHLSSYIQSRSYRAPEVVLGCDYDGRIDVWSLGAILVELVTGAVLFTSETVPEMLARMVYVCGRPLPRHMLWEGRHTSSFVNKFGCIYEMGSSTASGSGNHHQHNNNHHHHNNNNAHSDGSGGDGAAGKEDAHGDDNEEPCYIYTPVHATRARATPQASDDAEDEDYAVLRDKLASAGMTDALFFSFVKACLTLDHKLRPTSRELLQHPFFAVVDDADEAMAMQPSSLPPPPPPPLRHEQRPQDDDDTNDKDADDKQDSEDDEYAAHSESVYDELRAPAREKA